MADYSLGYGGVGSGLDITGMVQKLVAADRKPVEARLTRLESVAKFKISALGKVNAAFDTLDNALKALKSTDAFDNRTSKVSAEAVVSVSTSKGSPLGEYQIQVQALATANKWTAGQPVLAEQRFGAGKLTLTLGDQPIEISVAADSTLADIRNAINDATRAKGVQTSIITSNDGLFLSVASSKTGAANGISLKLDQGGADLKALIDSMSERVPAADAQVTVDGLKVSASGNTLTSAVPGLTLNLKAIGSSTVTLSSDVAASRKLVQDVVSAYNGLISAIQQSTEYDATTNTPSALTGDAQMRNLAGQLRSAMGEQLKALAAQGLDAKTLGLQTRGYPASDGSLTLDVSKFDALMASDPEKMIAAFTGAQGMAGNFQASLASYTGKQGSLARRNDGINAQIKDIANERKALDARMESVGNRYKAQFVALDRMLAQMNSTSSYLSQQLASLASLR